MKVLVVCFVLLVCSTGAAAQDVVTSFTLGAPTSNCIPVLTQDGVDTAGQGSVCPNGFFGGTGIQVWLPTDPISPGNSLTMYQCATSVASDTVPAYNAKTQQAPGSLVQNLACQVQYGYFSATWSGTLTYNYVGGRGAHCVTGFYPVWASGSGTISTPPPPPPPPQPTVTTVVVALHGGACDANFVCDVVPSDSTSVTGATLDASNYFLTVNNADGSVSTSPLDALQVTASGDDGDAYLLEGSGTLFDANGNSDQTVDVQLTIKSNDGGPFNVVSGTLSITTTTNP
jgi:hypothetical protein